MNVSVSQEVVTLIYPINPYYKNRLTRSIRTRDGAVARALASQMWPGFDSETQRHMSVEFVGSLLFCERFLTVFSGFPLSLKLKLWFDGAVFNWLSKVISELLWFCITSLSDWIKVLAPFFDQSEVKPKPIVACSCTFPRALCRLQEVTSSFDWFTGLSPFVLIGQSNYFGFCLTTLDWNSLYMLTGWFDFCKVSPISA